MAFPSDPWDTFKGLEGGASQVTIEVVEVDASRVKPNAPSSLWTWFSSLIRSKIERQSERREAISWDLDLDDDYETSADPPSQTRPPPDAGPAVPVSAAPGPDPKEPTIPQEIIDQVERWIRETEQPTTDPEYEEDERRVAQQVSDEPHAHAVNAHPVNVLAVELARAEAAAHRENRRRYP